MANKIGSSGLYEGIRPSNNKNVFGWNSNHPVFRRLIGQTRPAVIFEVGSWLGASAINMAKITKELGLHTKIYCIDTWLGAEEFWTRDSHTPERNLECKNGYPQVYFKFLSNIVEHGLQDCVTPVPNTSHIGSMILKHMGLKADMIYIDGSHEFEDVKSDIKDYMPLLRQGGVMFGDDMNWESVNRAVKESLRQGLEVVDNHFWVFKKN